MSAEKDDSDETSLFRKAMSDVNQSHKNYQNQRAGPNRKHSKPQINIAQKELLSRSHSSTSDIDETDNEDRVLFIRSGLQRKAIRQLKRGDFRIQSTLDLHGLRTSEAESNLNAFLSDALINNDDCVLIIHGKGINSENRVGVLRSFTISWLKQISEVKAFCSAQPRDGGTGAVYVLLKTARKSQSEIRL